MWVHVDHSPALALLRINVPPVLPFFVQNDQNKRLLFISPDPYQMVPCESHSSPCVVIILLLVHKLPLHLQP